MNITKYITIGCVAAAMMLASCSKDGDTIYTGEAQDVTLDGTTDDIVLDFTHLNALVLTVYWTENGSITLSDPRVEAPAYAITNVVQMSGDPEFASYVETTMNKGVYSRQYTCAELNNLLGRMGFEGGVQAPLYIRVKSVLGDNIAPTYSNTLKVNVTPYLIDMTQAKFLDKSKTDTGRRLYSKDKDGIYRGFIGAGGWENWYLEEGNGVLWGNENVGWVPFVLGSSNDNTAGNMWYPGISGCYYTIVDTKAQVWSSLLIPALTIGGDLQGEMIFDRKANRWTFPMKAVPGTLNITISGTGALYNKATGTNDNDAIATDVHFSGSPSNLEFNQTSGAPTIIVPVTASGDATLILDLYDPTCWTVIVEAGSVEQPEPVNHYLYMGGISDGSGSWTYNERLILYNEDGKNYGGAMNVNSAWGYVYMNQAWWGDGYGFNSGDAMSGQLGTDTSSNIPAPEAGEYVFDVSLSGMTYKLTKIESVSYAGLNDDWSLAPMTRVAPCVYEAEVTKCANTPWGVKVIINNDWGVFFGGGNGELLLNRDGFDGDNELADGSYILHVDMNKGTYSYTAK